MVRLDQEFIRDTLGIKTSGKIEIFAKVEGFSAGGSVKDRIALNMLESAEKDGRIRPGDILIEPTSGNTGIGLCLAAAVKGYKVIITLPKKMSGEKVNTMKGLGATIYRTPTEAAWNDLESHIALAIRLENALNDEFETQKVDRRAVILDQYRNPNNPGAHYDATGAEMAEQLREFASMDSEAQDIKPLDYLVVSAGTGGTLTGVARRMKAEFDDFQVVGVDPYGSILGCPEEKNLHPETKEPITGPYHVEGIGYDFIPSVLDRSLVEHWVKTWDNESFSCSRLLIQKQGLLVGGSSGSALAGLVRFIRENQIESGRFAVVFPDSVRNYMSKFLDDEWLQNNNFEHSDFQTVVHNIGRSY